MLPIDETTISALEEKWVKESCTAPSKIQIFKI
jgi:hypothetical protein